MKKIILSALGVSALALCSPANASIINVTGSPNTLTLGTTTTLDGNNTTISFNDSSPATSFLEKIFFTNSLDGVYTGAVITSSSFINYASAVLYGPGMGPTSPFTCSTTKMCGLSNTFLAAGNFELDIAGTNSGVGSVAGTVDFSAVPEPATWALMLFGFFGMGVAVRRGRKQGLTQLI